MSQGATYRVHSVLRRAGESCYSKATLTGDTIVSATWDAAPAGCTRSAPVTGAASTEAIYTFPTAGTYTVNCVIVTTGGQTWKPGWRVTVS